MNVIDKIKSMFLEIRNLLSILSPMKKRLILLLLLSLIGGGTILFEVNALTYIINKLSEISSSKKSTHHLLMKELLPSATIFLFAIFLRGSVSPIRGWISAFINEDVNEVLKKKCYEKIGKIQYSEFESPDYYDKLERVNRLMNGRLVQAIDSVAVLIMSVIEWVMIIYLFSQVNIFMSLVTMIGALPLTYYLSKAYYDFTLVNYEQTPERRRKSYWQSLSTSRSYAAELRLYQLGKYFLKGWTKVNNKLVTDLKRERKKLGLKTMSSQSGLLVLIAIILGFTIYQGVVGNISIGLVVSTIYLINRFESVTNELLISGETLFPVLFEMRYISEFLSLPEEVEKDFKIDDFENITLENVEFKYPGQTNAAIKKIGLTLKKGERIAIVGENGSGKTTLAKLLLGLYEPTKGCMEINGVNYTRVDKSSWRRNVGAVFQNFYKYKMTVNENITASSLVDGDDQEIINAAIKGGIHPVIKRLPLGYKTILGKEYAEGQDLSGGEWQKIAISRAYYRNSSFLILDEPAAALDPHAEFDLYEQFYKLSKDKTIVLISHRLGSARLAERIIHMEDGCIIEEGTHNELMTSNGKYAQMYNKQAEWYVPERRETN